MQTSSKLKLIFLSLILIMFSISFGSQKHFAFAGTDDKVSGWAWNSGVGWISFNSTGCDADCNSASCSTDAVCPPAGTSFANYGVSISPTTGNFSGYAWNDNVGWISFVENGSAVPGFYDFNTNCSGTCNNTNSCTACYKSSDNKVYGWAKILSMEDNGWIKFTNTVATPYDTKIVSGEMSGWAYNEGTGGAGIGWISFNAKDCDTNSDGTIDNVNCGAGAISDYKVSANLNAPPIISDFTAPNLGNNTQICEKTTILTADIKWKYNDDSLADGSAYQIDVTGSDGESFHTGKCLKSNGDTGVCIIDFNDNPNQFCLDENAYCTFTLDETIFPEMDYGVTYNWTITVWDDVDAQSSQSGTPFTTHLSEFPTLDITHLPLEINAGQDIQFKSGAKYHDGFTWVACDDAHCDYFWEEISGSNANIATDDEIDTIINFNTATVSTIQFTVTDANSYSCSGTSDSDIKQKLPKWIETKK